ncbi:unnamed protein product, partial [Chrysoparadoxa australica]
GEASKQFRLLISTATFVQARMRQWHASSRFRITKRTALVGQRLVRQRLATRRVQQIRRRQQRLGEERVVGALQFQRTVQERYHQQLLAPARSAAPEASELHRLFTEYCGFSSRQGPPKMELGKMLRMFKDAPGLMGKGALSKSDVELSFSKLKPKGHASLPYASFLKVLIALVEVHPGLKHVESHRPYQGMEARLLWLIQRHLLESEVGKSLCGRMQ